MPGPTLHIRDRVTGLFYDKLDFNGHTAKNPNTLTYSPKGLGKAFKDLGKVKIHLLYLIGNWEPPQLINDLRHKVHVRMRACPGRTYQSDPEYQRLQDEIDCWHAIHPGYLNVPEWMSNPYPLNEIPATWEVVEVTDKKQRIWTKVDLDPAAYAVQAQKLRRLTDTYGSAVRDVYKKLEKSGKMSDMPWVAAVMLDPSTMDQKPQNGWDGVKIDVAPVDEAIKQMGIKRSDMVRSTKNESVAIAFRTHEEAFWFKMCYGGIDRVGIMEVTHLDEVVDAPLNPIKR